MSQIKNRSYQSGYFTVPESKNKLREISQPVRITQLLGLPQNSEKKSAVKISMPEKLTPYLKSSLKKDGVSLYKKLSCGERNVRRNLDFRDIQTTEKPKTFVKTDTYIIEKLPEEKEKLCLSRKSFLLPPNTIKDSHVKNTLKQKKPVFFRSNNVRTNSENRYLRIAKVSESYLPVVQNSNTYTNPIVYGKSNKTSVIQYTSSQTFNMNDQSGINILHSPNLDHTDEDMVKKEVTENLKHEDSLDINISNNEKSDHKIATNVLDLSSTCIINTKMDTQYNIDQNIFYNTNEHPVVTARVLPDTEKIQDEAHSTNVEEEKCLSTNIHEDLHLSSQVIKTINELCMNSQYNTDNGEYIIINKTEFTNLASKLELLICRLEKDMSDLKLTLTTITDTLSAANMTNKIDELQIKQQMIKHLNNNAEAMNSTNTKSLPCITNSAICIRDNILKETSQVDSLKLPETDIFKESNVETPLSCQIDSENKENKVLDSTKYSKSVSGMRRRSARLMAKSLNNLDTTNDSFVNLENELQNVNSNETITSCENYTPVSGKYKNKKVEKPLKEYMSLKSRGSCLLTPKRFNSMNSECNAHPESDGAKVSLSNKILAELNNLYADSPNTQ
ncbi:hypothetical protein HN011_005344 [Eciton burchellii]|nr:hypothetical protein HN011_005344 [Eciton burchellii]